jgi:hypothetical protein
MYCSPWNRTLAVEIRKSVWGLFVLISSPSHPPLPTAIPQLRGKTLPLLSSSPSSRYLKPESRIREPSIGGAQRTDDRIPLFMSKKVTLVTEWSCPTNGKGESGAADGLPANKVEAWKGWDAVSCRSHCLVNVTLLYSIDEFLLGKTTQRGIIERQRKFKSPLYLRGA